jgi:hypothetical protein
MECSECSRLLAGYERLERDYAEAVHKLNARRNMADTEEYIGLRVAADGARLDSEVTRLELKQHRRMHEAAN